MIKWIAQNSDIDPRITCPQLFHAPSATLSFRIYKITNNYNMKKRYMETEREREKKKREQN